MKKLFKQACLLTALLTTTAFCACAPSDGENPAEYANPVFSPVFADPCIIRGDDGTFYAYATEDYGNFGGEDRIGYLPILKSDDLVGWEYVGDVFSAETKPEWGHAKSGTWAPDIVKIGDVYNLYYSLSIWNDGNPGIGVCTSASPAGPWQDRGMILSSETSGVRNSIDSFTFLYEDSVYMVWGSFHGLYMIELASDGLSVKEQAEPVLVGGMADSSDFEAAYMIEKDGYYYLFLSLGHCCQGIQSSYYVNVVRSRSPLGPWEDRKGNRLLSRGTVGELVVKGSEDVMGPGHNCAIRDDNGDWWLVYHGYETKYVLGNYGSSPRRSLFIDKLLWDEDGFPHLDGYRASYSQTSAPYIAKG